MATAEEQRQITVDEAIEAEPTDLAKRIAGLEGQDLSGIPKESLVQLTQVLKRAQSHAGLDWSPKVFNSLMVQIEAALQNQEDQQFPILAGLSKSDLVSMKIILERSLGSNRNYPNWNPRWFPLMEYLRSATQNEQLNDEYLNNNLGRLEQLLYQHLESSANATE